MTQNKNHKLNAPLNALYGICFMLLNAIVISILYGIAKEVTKEVSSHLVVFLYKFFILVLALPWCFKDGLTAMKTNRIFLHMSRGFLSISGSLCLYYAIQYIEIVDITAIGYLEQVILVIIGVLYFNEKATLAKGVCIILSFFGAILVVYPGIIAHSDSAKTFSIDSINPYYIFVFLSIAFWAANCTVIKVLGKTEGTKVQLFYVTLFSSIIASPLAFCKWELLTTYAGLPIKGPTSILSFEDLGLQWHHLQYILILALCYFVHSIAFFKALTHADLSTVIPFDYTRLIFTGIIGYFFFAETPEYGSYIGYAMIMVAGIYLAKSEAKRRRKLKEFEKMKLEEEYEHA